MARFKLTVKRLMKIAFLMLFVSSMFPLTPEVDHEGLDMMNEAQKNNDVHITSDVQPVMAQELDYDLTIATYNIRHGKGLDEEISLQRIIADLLEEGVDIVALQEVDRYNIRSGFKDQVSILGEQLEMAWVFGPSLRLGMLEYGNAVLSKYPIEESEVYPLSGDIENRSLLKVKIRYQDMLVDIWNTHLGVSEQDRESQLPTMLEIINDSTDEDEERAIIIMGDFNMLDHHPIMSTMMKDWTKLKLEGLAATVLSGLEIDHMFTNEKIENIKGWAKATDSSDHNPVFGWIKFRTSNEAF